MIKIEIRDKDLFKQEYLHLVKDLVKVRIGTLLKSIDHLKGANIDVSQKDFIKYKHVTRNIINSFIDGNSLPSSSFNKNKYKKTVELFLRSTSKKQAFNNINFNGISQFLTYLDDSELENLLLCEAGSLKSTNNNLLKKYKIQGDENKTILQRAFNYKEFEDVSQAIKTFFRARNLVKFCPYCNLTEVEFIGTSTGRVATTHELDHFFDKSSFPLLSYSVFNLIPSDRTCNGPNKLAKEFKDDYHINPYISGFEKKMKFKPVGIGRKVNEICISILADPSEKIFNQMLGSGGKIDEDSDEGNINVFTLYSKYKARTVRAEDVLETIYRSDKGRRTIKKFLDKLRGLDIDQHYKTWYKQNIKTSFDEYNFHENAYSKFNRDIHDFYFSIDKKSRNDYIRNLIK